MAPRSSSPGAARRSWRETAGELGEGCSWVSGDIRDRAGAEAIVSAALERHGRLDFLLNNAGGQYFVPAEGITAKGWNAVQRLNVSGTLTMCEAAYELAMRAAGGTIVNVTVSPHQGFPAMAHTGAARAAVESLTRSWRRSGRPTRSRSARSRSAGWPPIPEEVPRRAVARARPSRSRSSAWARSRSTAGWSRCWPRRWGGRCRGRWSRSTARWTTGPGRGRLRISCATATFPPRRGAHRPPQLLPATDSGRKFEGRRDRTPPRAARGGPPRYHRSARGRSVVVAQKPSKLLGRVRFPSPALAPVIIGESRGVAQSGSAPGWGPGGRRFKSCLPDGATSGKSKVAVSGSSIRNAQRASKGHQTSALVCGWSGLGAVMCVEG